jgi:hypothetical protein
MSHFDSLDDLANVIRRNLQLPHFFGSLAGSTITLITITLFNNSLLYYLSYLYPYFFGYLAIKSTGQVSHLLTSLALGTVFTTSPIILAGLSLIGGSYYLYSNRLHYTLIELFKMHLIETATIQDNRIDIPYYYEGIKYRVNMPINDKPSGLIIVTGKGDNNLDWSRVTAKTYEYLGPNYDFLGNCPPRSVLDYHTISVKTRSQDQRYHPISTLST